MKLNMNGKTINVEQFVRNNEIEANIIRKVGVETMNDVIKTANNEFNEYGENDLLNCVAFHEIMAGSPFHEIDDEERNYLVGLMKFYINEAYALECCNAIATFGKDCEGGYWHTLGWTMTLNVENDNVRIYATGKGGKSCFFTMTKDDFNLLGSNN